MPKEYTRPHPTLDLILDYAGASRPLISDAGKAQPPYGKVRKLIDHWCVGTRLIPSFTKLYPFLNFTEMVGAQTVTAYNIEHEPGWAMAIVGGCYSPALFMDTVLAVDEPCIDQLANLRNMTSEKTKQLLARLDPFDSRTLGERMSRVPEALYDEIKDELLHARVKKRVFEIEIINEKERLRQERQKDPRIIIPSYDDVEIMKYQTVYPRVKKIIPNFAIEVGRRWKNRAYPHEYFGDWKDLPQEPVYDRLKDSIYRALVDVQHELMGKPVTRYTPPVVPVREVIPATQVTQQEISFIVSEAEPISSIIERDVLPQIEASVVAPTSTVKSLPSQSLSTPVLLAGPSEPKQQVLFEGIVATKKSRRKR